MSDDFEKPSDDVLRECARREQNFWKHAMPVWLEQVGKERPPVLTRDVRTVSQMRTLEEFGFHWMRHLTGMDEAPYTPPFPDTTKYLVKDPKEPYRRSPSLEKMEGLVTDWADYPANMPCTFRTYEFNPGGAPLETRHPIRLNKVTWHLFPFRNTAPQTTFTHPERRHWLKDATGTYYTVGGPDSALRDVMVKRLLLKTEYLTYNVQSKRI